MHTADHELLTIVYEQLLTHYRVDLLALKWVSVHIHSKICDSCVIKLYCTVCNMKLCHNCNMLHVTTCIIIHVYFLFHASDVTKSYMTKSCTFCTYVSGFMEHLLNRQIMLCE